MSFLAALAPTLLSTIGSTVGNAADNTAMSALNQEDEQFQMGMYAQQMQHQEQMQVQSTMFDEAQDERSENMREINTLRDIGMQSRKADNDITKKFIQSITE
jgi:hypothetical protein